MRRGTSLRVACVLALLLPGLVLAAPTAGACGHCDRRVPCQAMSEPEIPTANHSCCGETAPATPAPSSFGAKACDCGHEAPLAVGGLDVSFTESSAGEPLPNGDLEDAESTGSAAAWSNRPPAPPPPLIFLIDCVFLT
jgi:hypothetical protein